MDVTIAYGAGDALTLTGVSPGALSAANFAFAESGTRLSFGAPHAKTIAPPAVVSSAIIWSACLSIVDSVFGEI